MAVGNFSVEASVIENGKSVKGMLMLFLDEYSFGKTRKSVNWEYVTCEQSTVKIKAFLRSIDKPAVVFNFNGERGFQFILEQSQMGILISKVKEFADIAKKERLAAEEKARLEAEEHQNQGIESKEKEEAKHQANEAAQNIKAKKTARIQRVIATCKNKPDIQQIQVKDIAAKAGTVFLDNPYRILGISCLATNEEANAALDKLKKLARLKALESYRSPYELVGVEKPIRDLSVAQNAFSLLKDKTNKFFWFAESSSCAAWLEGKYRIELSRDGQEFGTYDLFLSNYMYAVLCDPDFTIPETWKRVLNFYCYICEEGNLELLRSRFTERELQSISNEELLSSFRRTIFNPLLMLCDRNDLDKVIRLYKCIKDCDNRRLEGLSRSVLSKLVSWFTEKEAAMLSYLETFDEETSISDEAVEEIQKRGEAYCSVVEPVLEIVLRDFHDNTVRYDMIKESYRDVTYQLMYVLNKSPDTSNAILFANKCYSYCDADDKRRIINTFGDVNIKSVDWNTPHTIWDLKGDDYYYGRGRLADYTQALYWYHKAADDGNMYSMYSIGICYQKGHGVPQSDKQAAFWFEKSAKAGNPQGAYTLAECYFTGLGVIKNIDSALKFWTEAAKLGHPSAKQRKSQVLSTVQVQRRNHRARNHVCHDLGFQMTTGPSLSVNVTLNKSANVYLVNAQGYQNYLSGNEFAYSGGHTTNSFCRIRIPSSNHWYLIVDNGDEPLGDITSSVKVQKV